MGDLEFNAKRIEASAGTHYNMYYCNSLYGVLLILLIDPAKIFKLGCKKKDFLREL